MQYNVYFDQFHCLLHAIFNNRSEGWHAGVNVGLAGDIAVTGGVNQGKGNGESREISHRHSQVGDRASQTRIEAGNQLEIKGGQVQGKQVTVNADRLSISSVQDQASHRSKQQDGAMNGSLGRGATVGGSYQNSKLQAEHVSVNQLSGIFAGDEGFDIKVKDNTHLAGAVITSTETAEEKKRNRLETGTLSTTALNNHSEYSGKGIGVSVSLSKQSGANQAQDSQDSKQTQSKSQYSKDQSVGYGKDGDNQSSTTQGGIYTSNIIISDKTQQAELAKGKGQTLEQSISEAKTSTTTEEWENNGGRDRSALENRFDEQAVRQEIGTQVSVTKQFGDNAPKAVAAFADSRIVSILNNANLSPEQQDEEMSKWAEGGIYRTALHTAVGLIGTGNVEGAVSAGGVAAAAPKLDQIQNQITAKLLQEGVDLDTADQMSKLVLNLGVAVVGISAGLDTSSTAYAVNTDTNNRQLHQKEIDILKAKAKELAQGNKDKEKYWLNLLYQSAYAKVDNKGNADYQEHKKDLQDAPRIPIATSMANIQANDYKQADQIVNSLSTTYGNQALPNKGDVYYFNATEAQRKDNNLLLTSNTSLAVAFGYVEYPNDQSRIKQDIYKQNESIKNQISNIGSGTVEPVYPEEWVGTGYAVGKGAISAVMAIKGQLIENHYKKQAEKALIDEINSFTSKSKASDVATMIGAYDPKTGRIAVGHSNAKITADILDKRTVEYIESKLNVKIGEFTDFCKNKVGACAEISAADQLIKQGTELSLIRFTQAVRPQHVYGQNKMPEKDSKANIEACSNCKITWPKGN